MGRRAASGMKEAGLVDHQLEALGTGERVPADPAVAVLEMEGRRAPQEQADPLAVLLGDLIEAAAGRKAGAEEMLDLQERIEALAFVTIGADAHGQRAVGVQAGRTGSSQFHPNLPCVGNGQMLIRKRTA